MVLVRPRRLLALPLVLSLLLVASGAPLLAQTTVDERAELGGRVFQADGVTPAAGVVVTLVQPDGETSFASDPTGAEGSFQVAQAPAGTYRVLADTGNGAYLASDSLTLDAGQNRSMALTLGGMRPNYQTSGSGLAPTTALPKWGKWLILGTISVAALLVIDQVTADEEEEASDTL